jgi:hypothetical protein
MKKIYNEPVRLGFGDLDHKTAQEIVDNLAKLNEFKFLNENGVYENFDFIPTIASLQITKHMINVIISELKRKTETKIKFVKSDPLTMEIRNDERVFFEIGIWKYAKFGEFLTDKRFDEDKLRQAVDNLLFRLDKAKA